MPQVPGSWMKKTKQDNEYGDIKLSISRSGLETQVQGPINQE